MTLNTHLLSLDRIKIAQEINSKKKALEFLSHLFAEDAPTSQFNIYSKILSREKLGSTALNNGIALPHGRIAELIHPLLAIVTLKKGIDFDANDKIPVDIIIALLVPEEQDTEHLEIIATIAKFFNSEKNINATRTVKTDNELYQLLDTMLSKT